ncbi:MAG: anti-sigma factor [Flavobacterium sp.]|nr:MAG: anti-sigma factor [Flavobacterium sp.]
MNTEQYISSGIIELYVAGVLSESENKEIYVAILNSPELLEEVIKIETTIIKLTAAVSPNNFEYSLSQIKEKLHLIPEKNSKELPIKYTSWGVYSGWAASFVLVIGLYYFNKQNNLLTNNNKELLTKQELLEDQIFTANKSLAEVNELNQILRDKNITTIHLNGQQSFSDFYAKVYWDKEKDLVYIDALGLPEPPKGKTYQVWSLKLNPLTPTSIGLLSDFENDENKVFALNNSLDSEAFGITLEPLGGSETPTMELLYALGVTINP